MRYIIIDGNAIGHANHSATKLTAGQFQTQAVFGTIKLIRQLRDKYQSAFMIVLWDGQAKFRLDLYPEYKGNRKAQTAEQQADKDAYRAQVPLIQAALERLGVYQRLCVNLEADDLAGHLVAKMKGKGHTLVVTGDRDWWQFISEDCTWYDPRNEGRTVDINGFFEATGYQTPIAFLQGKALQGDSSDNIPGVGGLGEKGAADFMAEFGSVGNFYKMIQAGTYTPKERKSKTAKSPHPEQFLASPEGRAIFARNLKLMNLLTPREEPPETYKTFKRVYQPQGFRAICEKLGFMSILKDFKTFCMPFELAADKDPNVKKETA